MFRCAGPLWLFVLATLPLIAVARHNAAWDSMFDVPNGFRSYQHEQKSHSNNALNEMAFGFEGFLDEGLEGDVRVPAQLHPPATKPHSHHKHHEEQHQPEQHKSEQHHHHHHAAKHNNADVAHHSHHAQQHHSHHHNSHGHAQSFLELEMHMNAAPGIGSSYTAPPAYPTGITNFPATGLNAKSSSGRPSTFTTQSSPQIPNSHATPDTELAWVMKSSDSKGYSADHPQKLTMQDALQSMKGFFKHTMKSIGAGPDAGPTGVVSKQDVNPEGWPQPFWWSHPPPWLDEVPSWMQRMQIKRANSKAASPSAGAGAGAAPGAAKKATSNPRRHRK